MKLYICDVTNEIMEEPYCHTESGFCIVEKYEHAYKKELPRFKNMSFHIYGLPFGDMPIKQYLGIGNTSSPGDPKCYFEIEEFPQSEEEAIEIKKLFFADEYCDLVWFRIHGSTITIPNKYYFCGYDITYVPDIEGAFSIINDCMFICKWHGCDEEGTAFSDYFESLNENGLFNDMNTALDYMKHYLRFDWSERGSYCICEIYRKN